MLLEEVLKLPNVPRLDLPEELRYEEVAIAPQPRLKLAKLERSHWAARSCEWRVVFQLRRQSRG